jgi:hypothetical protein
MSLAEQLGNVGSDFERALRWKEKKQTQLFNNATARTLELLDLTIKDVRWQNNRLQELTRLREEVFKELSSESNNQTSIKGLQKYFLSMAHAARIRA